MSEQIKSETALADDKVTDEPIDCQLLDGYELMGWKPSSSLSYDDNVMDLVMLITRSSHCRQGSMACVLTNPISVGVDDVTKETIYNSLISVATNRPLFSEKDSDVHAEVAALGLACRTGSKTEGCTAYITMPPCKRCFAALTVAGVSRIVTRLTCPEPIKNGAQRNKIELVALGNVQEQTARINTLIYGDPKGKKREVESQTSDGSKRQKLAKDTEGN